MITMSISLASTQVPTRPGRNSLNFEWKRVQQFLYEMFVPFNAVFYDSIPATVEVVFCPVL